ncbi:glycerol-3-phosphate dehydrogenase/oxidase [Peribacillus sp. B-H-3]|uniref:glycerol-3-phosphate dehydrogenase/oxidase n=1 Tax=Peribacillus sp. B-H-3 TaxID=3400420 RepID=UPI003B015AD9
MKFSNLNRGKVTDKLQSKEYDLLIIGGGITGCGISLDAASRGLKTALVEMQDFASGTSSRSTKLVHGGLRYLKQLEVSLVAEVGKERAIVYENGPHVTTPEWMLLPFHEGGNFGKFSTSVGLRVYDFLAGVKRKERRTMLSREETLSKAPLVKKTGLKGGGYYVEYRTDDARLTIEVAKKAADIGADLLNYAKVTDFVYKEGRIAGAVIKDMLTGKEFTISAKKIVNAAGPWVDDLRGKDHSKKGKTLHLTKGVHIVIDQKRFPLKQAVYFDTPDKRMVFAIPREGKAYVGTTDTFYENDPVNPKMTKEDRDYLLDSIHYMFPDVGITEDDVESSWAGVRPLIHEDGKDPSEISRKDEIWVSDSGLITIAGGKLTGYRKMSKQVTDKISLQFEKEYGIKFDDCQTEHMPISGGDVGGASKFQRYIENRIEEGTQAGLSRDSAEKLAKKYGSNISKIFQIHREKGSLAEKYHLPKEIFAMLVYAIEDESAASPDDFLLRRTGAILFDIAGAKRWSEGVIAYMEEVFSWSESRKLEMAKVLKERIREAEFPSEF